MARLNINQQRLLRAIHDHLTENNGSPPFDKELAEKFGYSPNDMWNRLDRLTKRGLVERENSRTTLSRQGLEYFATLPDNRSLVGPLNTLPTQIRVVGQVKAGNTSADILEFDENSQQTIQIPDVGYEKNTFAYEVVGESMIHEDILEGDYVIVESIDQFTTSPSIGELIIARYIPYYMKEEFIAQQISDSDYLGPTIKRYYTKKVNGHEVVELGWKGILGAEQIESGQKKIVAIDVRAIGRVVGLFRNLRQ